MIQGTTPGKERVKPKGTPYPLQPFRQNSIVVRIKPIADIFLDGIPEHDEKCCIVWEGGRRKIKFINRACLYHNKVECLVEAAN